MRGEFPYIPTMAGYVSVSECDSKDKVNYNYIHLCMPSIRLPYYIAFFLWFALYISFGFVQAELRLGMPDPKNYGYICGGIQLGASVFSIWLVSRLGRLGSLTFYYTLGGVLCILSVAFTQPTTGVEDNPVTTVVHLVAVIII